MFSARTRISIITVAILMVLMMGTVTAYAAVYNPPWSHLHYLDATYKLGWAGAWVAEMGYTNYNALKQSSYSAYTHWKSDSLFIFCGHGGEGGGGIWFEGGGWIFAEDKTNASRPNADPYYFIKNFASTDVNDTLVAMFIGCQTAVTHTAKYGNLLSWARSRGVDCAIGWQQNIWNEPASVFGMGFIRGARFSNLVIDSPLGYNSGSDNDLMQYAYNYAMMNSASPLYVPELKYWTTQGQYGQRLQPARYGTP